MKNYMEGSHPQTPLSERKLNKGCSQVGLSASGKYDLRLALGIHTEHIWALDSSDSCLRAPKG